MVKKDASRGLKPRPIDNKYRVVLPPRVRSALGVQVGDFVSFEVEGKEVRLRRVRLLLE